MQKDFFKSEELQEKSQTLISNINSIVQAFRNKNLPVIWVKQVWSEDLSDAHPFNRKTGNKQVIEGTTGSELLDELDFSNLDFQVIKKRYSGFFRTNLNNLLQEQEIHALVFCGINTHACVRTTIIDAYQRDYECFIGTECVASYDQEHHEITLKYLKQAIAQTMTNQEIIDFLKNCS